MDLLKQIDQLEEKLNIKGYKNSQIWIQDLDNAHFDIKRFFQAHFATNNQVDYGRINQSLEIVQNIQKETFEEIAVQVDMNLDKYVQICNQFDTMKDYFNTTDTLYKNIVEKMQKSKDSCQDQIKKVNEILENYNLVCDSVDNLQVLDKLVSYNKVIERNIKEIKDFFSNNSLQFPGFKILNTCKLLNECKNLFKQTIEVNHETRELSQKYNLVGVLNEQATSIIQNMDQFLEKKLNQFYDAVKEQEKQPDLQLLKQIQVVFNALAILNQVKLAEKKVSDILIKPQLDQIFSQALQNKSNMIAATRQQFLAQQSRSKTMSVSLISEGVRTFVEQEYGKFISIFQYSEEGNGQFQVFNFDFIKLLWEEIYRKMISKEMIFLYSVGIPDVFHLNYTLSMLILKFIKNQYKSKKEQAVIYETELKFMEKWNLQTYFQMRQAEIVKNFEQELKNGLEKLNVQGDGVSGDVIQILVKYVDLALSREIFIEKIGFQFIKLILQLSKKYSQSLQQYAEKNNIKNISLINQLSTLQKEVPDNFLKKIRENYKINQSPNTEQQQQEKNQILIQFQYLIKQILKGTVKIYLQTALKEVVQVCIDQLETLNSIPQKFRIHGKEMPTAPSNICSNILMNLSNFLQKNNFEPDAQNMIKEEVISQVFIKFLKIESEIIESSTKSLQIMQKLSGNMKNGQNNDNQPTELDKIRRQFQLDKQELQDIVAQKYDIQNVEELIQQYQEQQQQQENNNNNNNQNGNGNTSQGNISVNNSSGNNLSSRNSLQNN